MGNATIGLLNEMGVIVKRVDDASMLAETVYASGRLAFDSKPGGRRIDFAAYRRFQGLAMTEARSYTLERRAAVAQILAQRGDALVVSGLGSSSWDTAAAGDRAENFYLWGAMGGAVMTGLGLALAQPTRSVLAITGDGELLMGIGSIATIAVQHPVNLSIVCIDNEHYGESGMQASHTRFGVDLAGIGDCRGFRAKRRHQYSR